MSLLTKICIYTQNCPVANDQCPDQYAINGDPIQFELSSSMVMLQWDKDECQQK